KSKAVWRVNPKAKGQRQTLEALHAIKLRNRLQRGVGFSFSWRAGKRGVHGDEVKTGASLSAFELRNSGGIVIDSRRIVGRGSKGVSTRDALRILVRKPEPEGGSLIDVPEEGDADDGTGDHCRDPALNVFHSFSLF